MSKSQVIILAAGRGSRMKSELPKVIHKVAGKTMLERVVDNALAITEDIIIVHSESLKPYLIDYPLHIKKVLQSEPRGTGHAVYCALPLINPEGYVIVLCGDNPFLDPALMRDMLHQCSSKDADLMIVACNRENPRGYGRVMLDKNNAVYRIIECRDATIEEKVITLCNSGIIMGKSHVITTLVKDLVERCVNNNREYYLTSIMEDAYSKGYKTSYFTAASDAMMGVNTREELKLANEVARRKK